jgi:hypothetical protein
MIPLSNNYYLRRVLRRGLLEDSSFKLYGLSRLTYYLMSRHKKTEQFVRFLVSFI